MVFNLMAIVTICSDFGAPQNKVTPHNKPKSIVYTVALLVPYIL